MKNIRSVFLTTILLSIAPLSAQAGIEVYFNDFESGVAGPAISGFGAVEGTQGYSAHGFGSSFFRNAGSGSNGPETILTLTDLPEHDSLDLGFLLAIIDSWDGNDAGRHGIDLFRIRVDGNLIFEETFTNFTDQEYKPGVGTFTQTQSLENRLFTPVDIGFNSWFDSVYDFNSWEPFMNIAHNADILTISFAAGGRFFNGGLNEHFAVDNLRVTLNTTTQVPEPEALGLTGLALIGLGVIRRRVKSLAK